MHITTTLGHLAQTERALRAVGALLFPPKVAFAIRTLASAVEVEMRVWHTCEETWIRELGQPDDHGYTTVAPEHRAEYLRRMAEVATRPVALDIQPLTLAELETGCDPATKQPAAFAPADLYGLGPLLVEGVLLPSAPAPQDADSAHDDPGVATSGVAATGGNGTGDGLAPPA